MSTGIVSSGRSTRPVGIVALVGYAPFFGINCHYVLMLDIVPNLSIYRSRIKHMCMYEYHVYTASADETTRLTKRILDDIGYQYVTKKDKKYTQKRKKILY